MSWAIFLLAYPHYDTYLKTSVEKFVRINTVSDADAGSKNWQQLNQVYNEPAKLAQMIDAITQDVLTTETVAHKKVLLKPNWVRHSLRPNDECCLRTHDAFVLATLQVVLEKKPASVTIGDAPVQSCNWDRAITEQFLAAVQQLSDKYAIPVMVQDFRRVTFDPKLNNPNLERLPLSDFVIFNLGKQSFLEEVSYQKTNPFRVTYYNPDRLVESHGPGVHKYCITKNLFDADLVISLPKVKTHQKAGLTAALKNLVGVNGDKDYLPHHRVGGTGFKGDCYPGGNYLRYWAELCRDKANRRQGKKSYWYWFKFSSLLWKLSLPGKEHHLGAGWHGNDTTWRMVFDLNKIAVYGRPDGSIAGEPQRVLYSLCDGIVGGQGDGPLHPDPLALGIISFTNHAAFNDVCMGKLMGFDVNKIALLKTAAKMAKDDGAQLYINGQLTNQDALAGYAVETMPPPGWQNYLKAK
ncbi:MAG: hypothetical protein RL172_2983 [Bacteroidota bacterium]